MATIQQSIEIKVPVQIAYDKLTHFEDYPRFMEGVEAVQQVDDTHLHWTAVMSNRPLEWDAEITEQEADRCIAWRANTDPANTGKLELHPTGSDASRVIYTWQSEPGLLASKNEEAMAHWLKLDLARLKDFIEAGRAESGTSGGKAHDAQASMRNRDAKTQGGRVADTSPATASGYAAGSEGWSGDEDPSAPVASSSGAAAEQRNDADPARSASARQTPSQSAPGSDRTQVNASTQSDYSLSKSSDDGSADDGRFSVAEELNFDQQSDAARQVGKMPPDTGIERQDGTSASDAMGKAMQPDSQDAKRDAKLKPSIDRSVPPSE